MSLDAEIQSFLGTASSTREKVQRALRRVLGTTSDARALYLDADGQMRPEAVRHFAALARIAYPHDRTPLDDATLREAAGAQKLLRHMLASINMDDDRIIHLKNRLAALERGST